MKKTISACSILGMFGCCDESITLSDAKWFAAIATIESGMDPSKVGDKGKAIGPFQIHREYWKDSKKCGRYEFCKQYDYSIGVMLRYWDRYCPFSFCSRNWEKLCRVHNGGPFGYKDKSTLKYWKKVQKAKAEIDKLFQEGNHD